MSGPRPTPTATLKLRGSWRANKRKGEPTPEPAIPACPEHLSDLARAEWNRVAPDLFTGGCLAMRDAALLAAYCQLWARWVECEQLVQQMGMVVKSPNGFPQKNPYLSIAEESLRQLKGFAAEFGMSPAARAKVNVQPPGVRDLLQEYKDANQEAAFAALLANRKPFKKA